MRTLIRHWILFPFAILMAGLMYIIGWPLYGTKISKETSKDFLTFMWNGEEE